MAAKIHVDIKDTPPIQIIMTLIPTKFVLKHYK